LFALLLGILNQIHRNTGYYTKYSMASVTVQGTGTTKSMLFLYLLVLPLLWKTLAFTQDLGETPRILPNMLQSILSRGASTLMTSYTFRRIPLPNLLFADS